MQQPKQHRIEWQQWALGLFVIAMVGLLIAILYFMANNLISNSASNVPQNIDSKEWRELLTRITRLEDYARAITMVGAAFVAVFAIVETWQSVKSTDSIQTVRLVNETLEFTRDASERAANAVKRQFNKEKLDLDAGVLELIGTNNFFDVSSVMAQSNRLTMVKIESAFDHHERMIMLANMINEDIPVSASGNFLRGMHFYANSNYDYALEKWKAAGNDDDTQDGTKEKVKHTLLRAASFYWAAHLHSNVGEFRYARDYFNEAVNVFHRSDKNTKGSKIVADVYGFVECSRSVIEAEFFNMENLLGVRTKITSLLDAAQNTYRDDDALQRVLLLAGNIHYAAGLNCNQPVDRQKHFEASIDYFKSIKDRSKPAYYAAFGRAQALLKLNNVLTLDAVGHNADEIEGLRRQLEDAASAFGADAKTRNEARSQATSFTAELLCRRFLGGAASRNELRHVERLIDVVDKRLTVYSPVSKRNVKKDAFIAELNAEGLIL